MSLQVTIDMETSKIDSGNTQIQNVFFILI